MCIGKNGLGPLILGWIFMLAYKPNNFNIKRIVDVTSTCHRFFGNKVKVSLKYWNIIDISMKMHKITKKSSDQNICGMYHVGAL